VKIFSEQARVEKINERAARFPSLALILRSVDLTKVLSLDVSMALVKNVLNGAHCLSLRVTLFYDFHSLSRRLSEASLLGSKFTPLAMRAKVKIPLRQGERAEQNNRAINCERANDEGGCKQL
jgi:hypothetical protein